MLVIADRQCKQEGVVVLIRRQTSDDVYQVCLHIGIVWTEDAVNLSLSVKWRVIVAHDSHLISFL